MIGLMNLKCRPTQHQHHRSIIISLRQICDHRLIVWSACRLS